MCGICGVAGGEPAAARDLVARMCAAMAHRGPDDAGEVTFEGAVLGMRRLSIIDVEGGHQPMANEDSTVWVVENGEIFNHAELRSLLVAAGHRFATRSDTEVLVHGYEEWGDEMVERLNGQFAFCIFDRGSSLLLLSILLVIVGVQFILMGLLAELSIRTYHESQSKPTYVVREVIERVPARPAATNGRPAVRSH